MNENIQIIERDGRPEYAVIPYAEYQRLRQLAEDAADTRAFDAALADEGEALPQELVRRLVEGDSPVRVWREYRGLTRADLAAATGVDEAEVARIEAGREAGSWKVMGRLAAALGIALDELAGA